MTVHHRPDSGSSDIVVSLDAFKITRHDGTDSLGMMARWKLHPLTPWACDMLRSADVLKMLQEWNGTPLKATGDGFITPSRGDLDAGVGFERRKDALGFLRDVERTAGRWPASSSTLDDYAASLIEELIARGPYEGEDFYRVKATGNGETKHFNVSPAQLAAFAKIMRGTP